MKVKRLVFFSLVAHLRLRPVDQNNPKTMFPPSSAITYWQLEMEDGPVNGKKYKNQFSVYNTPVTKTCIIHHVQ